MFTFSIELASQKRKDSTHAILLRITHDRKHKRVSTGFFVTKDEYKGVKGDWVNGDSDLNQSLLKLLEEVTIFVDDRRKTLKKVTSEHIAKWVKDQGEVDFLQFAQKEVNEYQKNDQYRTFLRYQNVIDKLKEYRYDDPLYFSDISVRFIKSYRFYLESLGNSDKTIFNDIACLRVLVNKAVEQDVISVYDNPFIQLKIKSPKAKKANFFTKEDLLEFEKVTPSNNVDQLAKNVFLFAVYMGGLRFGDVVAMKWKSILNNQLTLNVGGVLNIHDKANEILRQYKSKTWSGNDYVFPFIPTGKEPGSDEELKKIISSKNATINKALKGLLNRTTITKSISFYTARHTFAYLASNSSKDLKSLSVVLGHTNEGQTKLYLETIKQSDEDALLQNTFYDI